MIDLLTARAQEQRAISDWLACRRDKHPQGHSGASVLLPKALTSNCWDTAPHAFKYSEWGRDAGFDL